MEHTSTAHDNPAFIGDNFTPKEQPFTLNDDKLSPKPLCDVSTSPKFTKAQMLKNLLLIGFGFLFNFTAFNALSNIQSSLNSNEGLGTTSLSAVYTALVVSCMFLPAVIIQKLGCKWAMVVSMLMYSTYIAANFYATWFTLIPTSILLGFGAAPLWSAKCTYLTDIGHQYAEIVGEKPEVIVVRFFGIFFMLFQSSQIWGNLISSLVLQPEIVRDNVTRDLSICGAQYCNEELGGTPTLSLLNSSYSMDTAAQNNQPKLSQVYMLCGIYLTCSIFAVLLIAVLVNPLKRVAPKTEITGFKLMIATFNHMKNPKQLLLIPLTIFSGMEQAFISGDFTKAFINCSMGIHNVGYVMICAGVVDAICSLAFVPLVKVLGRLPLYVFGATLNTTLALTMLYWQPDVSAPVVFFVLTGFWGMADAIWQTQINAFYGVLFSDNTEAAFANYRLWESVGFIIGFAWSNYLCINVKLYALLLVLILGMFGYFCIEAIKHLQRKSANITTVNKD